MNSKRSWKWLAPRITSRHVRNADSSGRTTSRPTLSLERLEDRNLLAVVGTNDSLATEPPPEPVGHQVLGVLLTDGVNVTANEFQLMKVLSEASAADSKVQIHEFEITKVLDKASPLLFQLNNTLVKVGQTAIRGQLTEKKFDAAEAKIEYLQVKLNDILISSFNADDPNLTLAAQTLDSLVTAARHCAQGTHIMKAQISARKAGKGQQEYIQLASDILRLENMTIKAEVDSLEGHDAAAEQASERISLAFQKVAVEYQKLNLEDQGEAFDGNIVQLLGSLSGGGDFEGGVLVPPTDDTIT